MAGSKKKVKQTKEPGGNYIVQGGNPEQYYETCVCRSNKKHT